MRATILCLLITSCAFTLFVGTSLGEKSLPKSDPRNEGHQFLPESINTRKSDAIKELISRELYAGAPPGVIESFFRRHDLSHSFDEFLNRYQATIPDVSDDPSDRKSVV